MDDDLYDGGEDIDFEGCVDWCYKPWRNDENLGKEPITDEMIEKAKKYIEEELHPL